MDSVVTVDMGVDAYMNYHREHSKKNSVRSFGFTLYHFKKCFSGRKVDAVDATEIQSFLEGINQDLSAATKHGRAGHISAMYNFVIELFDLDFRNPCTRGIIKKLYKAPRPVPPDLPDKDIIDELIHRTDGRDRLILELMGLGAMRVGEVLMIRPRNINLEGKTIALENPKSGRQGEVVHLHQKLIRKVNRYVKEHDIGDDDRIFPVSYTTVFRMVKQKGRGFEIELRPHDLRRCAATWASRKGTPLELVSKVILRHADLATTQRYLGKVSHAEASQMMESLYG